MFDHVTWVLAQAAPEAGGQAAPAPAPAPANGPVPTAPQPTQVQPGAAPSEAPAQRPQSSPWASFLPFILIIVVLYVILFLPQRKEKKRRQQMLAVLKKGDRVQTVGGVLGTIVEVRPNEVMVKVDESTNTRLRFSRSAIQAVVSEGDEA